MYKIYGSLGQGNSNRCLIVTSFEVVKGEFINPNVAKKVGSEIYASTNEIFNDRDVAIFTLANLHGKNTCVFSGENIAGVVPPSMFSRKDIEQNIKSISEQVLRAHNAHKEAVDTVDPISKLSTMKKHPIEITKVPEMDDMYAEYPSMLKLVERVASGEININLDHWNDYVKIIETLYEGFVLNRANNCRHTARTLTDKYNRNNTY